jgi:phosphoesterase RecJ-like protein
MNAYVSNMSLQAVAQLLLSSQQLTLTTHAKPDGDAFGSVTALGRALHLLGKRVHVLVMPPVPAGLRFLQGSNIPDVYKPQLPLPESDLYVVVDTGAWGQLVPMDLRLREKTEKLLVVDHHLSGDVPAAYRYIDGKAAACAEIIAQLIELLEDITGKQLMDAVVCEQLFVGIASDTGWFRFSNTRPQTHELAAKLMHKGVDHSALFEKLEQNDRPEKLALLTRALDNMHFLAGFKGAIMVLSARDFEETGALIEETERLVDLPRNVAGVQVVAMISQPPTQVGQAAQPVRVSFRSKPGEQAVNVAELAAQFGGGGHARAAGAKIDAPLEEVVARVSQAIVMTLQGPVTTTQPAEVSR